MTQSFRRRISRRRLISTLLRKLRLLVSAWPRLRRCLVSVVLTCGLSLGSIIAVAPAAEAATYVDIINFSSRNIYVNGHKVKPLHNRKHVKRKTMTVRTGIEGKLVGMNKNDTLAPTQACLQPGVNYKGGVFKSNKKLSDGSLNRFGFFEENCG